jgi:hypothetical protein
LSITLEQHGTHCHPLRGDEGARSLFGWAARIADSASMVLFRVPVLANPGKKVQRKLIANIRELGLDPATLDFWSVSGWIGTASRPRFMLRSSAAGGSLVRLAGLSDSVFWCHGEWEDLVLYRGGKVVYYCTTHEEEGAVFGSRAELTALGLDSVASSERWLVEGERFDDESSRALIAALAESSQS